MIRVEAMPLRNAGGSGNRTPIKPRWSYCPKNETAHIYHMHLAFKGISEFSSLLGLRIYIRCPDPRPRAIFTLLAAIFVNRAILVSLERPSCVQAPFPESSTFCYSALQTYIIDQAHKPH